MTIYSVYLPPENKAGNDADDFCLVPDKNSILALAVPLFWLIWQRLWLVLLAYIVYITGVSLLAASSPGLAVLILSMLPGIYLLLEGNHHVMNRLERNGWRFSGVVEAADRESAEIRFLVDGGLTSEQDSMRADISVKINPPVSHPRIATQTGLFPE